MSEHNLRLISFGSLKIKHGHLESDTCNLGQSFLFICLTVPPYPIFLKLK